MVQVLFRNKWVPELLQESIRKFNPKSNLGKTIRECFQHLPPELAGTLLDQIQASVVVESSLSLTVIKCKEYRDPTCLHAYTPDFLHCTKCGEHFEVDYLGIVGTKVITTAGVNYLVDVWQNSVELETVKYHRIGTGVTAEAVGDTALVTELTTEYNPDSTGATGTTTEGASANIFRSVGTNTLDGTPGAALREHMLAAAATGATTCWDRTLYAAITLSSGDGLQSTYDMTASSGG